MSLNLSLNPSLTPINLFMLLLLNFIMTLEIHPKNRSHENYRNTQEEQEQYQEHVEHIRNTYAIVK